MRERTMKVTARDLQEHFEPFKEGVLDPFKEEERGEDGGLFKLPRRGFPLEYIDLLKGVRVRIKRGYIGINRI